MSDRDWELGAWSEARPNIACPACGYSPRVGQQWTCSPDGCEGSFDTFETGGRCPHCDAQFPWTECPACGRRTAHRAWYHGGAAPRAGGGA